MKFIHFIRSIRSIRPIFFLGFFAVLILFFSFHPIFASRLTELEKQIKEKQSYVQELEKQLQETQKKLQATTKQKRSLSSQVNYLENQIHQTKLQIKLTQAKINETNLGISETKAKIKSKEEDLSKKKTELIKNIRLVYQLDQISPLEIILGYNNFSDLLSQIHYSEVIQENLQQELNNLRLIKKSLEEKERDLQNKKDRLKNLTDNLQRQKFSFTQQVGSKNYLLQITRGQEKEYQKMLSRLKKQKDSLMGDLQELVAQKKAELERLRAEIGNPKNGLASTQWYFSQTDPRWKNKTIGYSHSTIGRYGCALTSVAMVMKYYSNKITPGQLAKYRIYSWDLISWPKYIGNISLISSTHHGNINWGRINQELKNGHPVIVRVSVLGTGAGHYIVIHHRLPDGRYIVHDPYFGANIYLDYTKQALTKIFHRKTKVTQMIIYH